MKLTKSHLKKIIKEELSAVLREGYTPLIYAEKGEGEPSTPEEAERLYNYLQDQIRERWMETDIRGGRGVDYDQTIIDDGDGMCDGMIAKWEREMQYLRKRYYELGGGGSEGAAGEPYEQTLDHYDDPYDDPRYKESFN